MNISSKDLQKNPLMVLVCLGLVVLPVSNAFGQVPLYLASVYWLIRALRGKENIPTRAVFFLCGFAIIILISLIYAVHPENGISKLNRFLIFPLVGAVTGACLRRNDVGAGISRLCFGLIAGVCILALYDFVKFPVEVFYYGKNFVDVGDMTSPQFYWVGLMLLLGIRVWKPAVIGKYFWLCLPLLTSGLLLHQKRGVWLASVITVGLWVLWERYWKALGVMILLIGTSLCFPFVQARLNRLHEVVKPTHDGRMVLWTQVSPRLLPKYPWGMGYNGSNYSDLNDVLPPDIHMQEGLRHLHNNFLQIRLELGWHGLFFWTVWMCSMLFAAFRRFPEAEDGLRSAVGFALLGLMINGLVEYNFGDSEVLMLYLILFGLLEVFALKARQGQNAAAAIRSDSIQASHPAEGGERWTGGRST